MEKNAKLIEGNYYWVKRVPIEEYEPAKCNDRYQNDELFFEFTDGNIIFCSDAYDYKELINPFNT